MDSSTHFSALSVADQGKVDEACERFESEWKSGQRPSLEAALAGWTGPLRAALLRELLHLERHYLTVTDGSAGDEEILKAHPSLADELARTQTMETARALHNTSRDQGRPGTGGQAGQAVPEWIGRYRVIGLIDAGGQARVYRAAHPNLPKELAIKIGRDGATLDPVRRDHLIEEGRLLAQLDHPNLARIVDLDFHEDRPFLVMEYVRGQNLSQHAKSQRLSPRRAAELVAGVARAVGLAHRQGIVHRDIKPANIILDEQSQPRLIDFGLSQLQDAWSDTSDVPGVVSGTVQFMAPEQARGETDRVGPRTDVFSLGAVLYWLLAGKAPFAAETLREALGHAQNCRFDRAALVAPRVPAPLREICLTAMAAAPEDRIASAEALATQLDSWLQSGEAQPTRQPQQLALAALAIACALGLAAWFAAGRESVRTTGTAQVEAPPEPVPDSGDSAPSEASVTVAAAAETSSGASAMSVDSAMMRLDRALAARDLSRQGQVEAVETLLAAGIEFDRKDLKGLNFADADFSGHSFRKANFMDADLTRVDLTGTQLAGADLSLAALPGATLREADLTEVYAAFLSAEEAEFEKAQCRQATFFAGRLRGANFTGADLQGADLTFCDLRGADFTRANLEGAFLFGSILDGATFDGARFANTDVTGARLDFQTLPEDARHGLCRSLVKLDYGKVFLKMTLMEEIPSDRLGGGFEYEPLFDRDYWFLRGFEDESLPMCSERTLLPAGRKSVYGTGAQDINAYHKVFVEHEFVNIGDRRDRFIARVKDHGAFLEAQFAGD